MGFIPSYAVHKTCTLVGALAFIHAISTAATAVTAAAAATPPPPPPPPPVRPGQGGHTNLATIMSNNHEPIDLHIPTNGDLAYADLNQKTDINEAIVLSHVKAVETDFANADRIYCYDGSRDREGTFTLFIEPDDEQVRAAGQYEAELLRVTVGKNDDLAEIPLYISTRLKDQLGHRRSARVRLLVCPIRKLPSDFIPLYDGRMAEPGCYFLVNGESGWGEGVGVFRIASLEPVDKYDTVVCFRSHDDYRMSRNRRQAWS